MPRRHQHKETIRHLTSQARDRLDEIDADLDHDRLPPVAAARKAAELAIQLCEEIRVLGELEASVARTQAARMKRPAA